MHDIKCDMYYLERNMAKVFGKNLQKSFLDKYFCNEKMWIVAYTCKHTTQRKTSTAVLESNGC